MVKLIDAHANVNLGERYKEDIGTVKDGADIQEQGGRTPLIWASKCGHVDCVKLLIDARADVNLGEGYNNDIGGTPLS